jgi:hypothetical protein
MDTLDRKAFPNRVASSICLLRSGCCLIFTSCLKESDAISSFSINSGFISTCMAVCSLILENVLNISLSTFSNEQFPAVNEYWCLANERAIVKWASALQVRSIVRQKVLSQTCTSRLWQSSLHCRYNTQIAAHELSIP